MFNFWFNFYNKIGGGFVRDEIVVLFHLIPTSPPKAGQILPRQRSFSSPFSLGKMPIAIGKGLRWAHVRETTLACKKNGKIWNLIPYFSINL